MLLSHDDNTVFLSFSQKQFRYAVSLQWCEHTRYVIFWFKTELIQKECFVFLFTRTALPVLDVEWDSRYHLTKIFFFFVFKIDYSRSLTENKRWYHRKSAHHCLYGRPCSLGSYDPEVLMFSRNRMFSRMYRSIFSLKTFQRIISNWYIVVTSEKENFLVLAETGSWSCSDRVVYASRLPRTISKPWS